MMRLNHVHSVRQTRLDGVYKLSINVTQGGETYDCDYVSDPSDPFGFNPVIRSWLAENTFTILPLVSSEVM